MKQRRAQTVNIDARVGLATEQLGRRVAHGAYRRNAFFLLVHPAGDSKVDQHYPVVVGIDHQVRRFQVAIDDLLRPRVQIVKHVGDLDAPLGDGGLVDPASGSVAQT